MNAVTFNLSVQGASHIKNNKECQDASLSYSDDEILIAISCDGHGGDDYVRSAIGSYCASKSAEKNLKNFMQNIDKAKLSSNSKSLIQNLEASIINDWNQMIYKHYDENPFTDEELSRVSEKARKRYSTGSRIESAYGTTLIAVCMCKDYCFGIHIGDGKCVFVDKKGEFSQPIPWDSKCFLNATTSICDSNAIDNFRNFYTEDLPAAIFVASDGIDDSFKTDEQLYDLYKTVIYSFATVDFDEAVASLNDYLPRLSQKGSGDDVSIAAILDTDLISSLDFVKAFDVEQKEADLDAKKRLEEEKKASLKNQKNSLTDEKMEDIQKESKKEDLPKEEVKEPLKEESKEILQKNNIEQEQGSLSSIKNNYDDPETEKASADEQNSIILI